MDEVLQELRALNARFEAFEVHMNKRLDAIDGTLSQLMALVVANNEDIMENRQEIKSLRELVEANSEAIERIESRFTQKISQIDSNSHDIQRLLNAFNAKYPGYLE